MIRILLSTKLGEMKWSQADLARATGIRPNTISELYHEYTDRVNLEHLDLICEALHCELDELIVIKCIPDIENYEYVPVNNSMLAKAEIPFLIFERNRGKCFIEMY